MISCVIEFFTSRYLSANAYVCGMSARKWWGASWPSLDRTKTLGELCPDGPRPPESCTNQRRVFWSIHMVECFEDTTLESFLSTFGAKIERFHGDVDVWRTKVQSAKTLKELFTVTPLEYFETYGY